MGTTRIQRQVILLLRRILSQISPEKLCTITGTCIPSFPFEEGEPVASGSHGYSSPGVSNQLITSTPQKRPESQPMSPSPGKQSASSGVYKRTVLNKLLAYVMKSIKLIVKSKGRRNGEQCADMNIKHSVLSLFILLLFIL